MNTMKPEKKEFTNWKEIYNELLFSAGLAPDLIKLNKEQIQMNQQNKAQQQQQQMDMMQQDKQQQQQNGCTTKYSCAACDWFHWPYFDLEPE